MLRSLLVFFAAGIIMLAPLSVSAAESGFFGPIVPDVCNCEVGNGETIASAPDWGCALQTLQNLVRLAISVAVVIVVLVAAYAGILLMTSPFNAENRSKAKSMLMNAVIGLVITLTSWLIVDFVMKALYNPDAASGISKGGALPWQNILGEGATKETLCLNVRPAGAAPVGGLTTGPVSCDTCVSLSDAGISCKDSNSCKVVPGLLDELKKISSSVEPWRVTEAFPPTRQHKNSCHRNGTCVDVAFKNTSNYSANTVSAFLKALSSAGLRGVFETDNCLLRTGLRNLGITAAFCKEDKGYEDISGTHFSVYQN